MTLIDVCRTHDSYFFVFSPFSWFSSFFSSVLLFSSLLFSSLPFSCVLFPFCLFFLSSCSIFLFFPSLFFFSASCFLSSSCLLLLRFVSYLLLCCSLPLFFYPSHLSSSRLFTSPVLCISSHLFSLSTSHFVCFSLLSISSHVMSHLLLSSFFFSSLLFSLSYMSSHVFYFLFSTLLPSFPSLLSHCPSYLFASLHTSSLLSPFFPISYLLFSSRLLPISVFLIASNLPFPFSLFSFLIDSRRSKRGLWVVFCVWVCFVVLFWVVVRFDLWRCLMSTRPDDRLVTS